MKIKSRYGIFETNHYETDREKTYRDLALSTFKKFGVYNLWKWHCMMDNKFIYTKYY